MEDDSNTFMTINVTNTKINKKIENNPLKNYIEIKPKYLKFFFGTWIKYISKNTNEYNSGGNLIELNYEYKSAYLRSLGGNSNIIRLYPLDSYIYYVKNDTENYRAYVNIMNEYEKIKIIKNKMNL
jgi:hypothetical protein